MNQLGFIVCFVFTTLIAVSTPKDIRVHEARAGTSCKTSTQYCNTTSDCCSGLCEETFFKLLSTSTSKQCACKLNAVTCTDGNQCCTGTCTNGVCACGKTLTGFLCKTTDNCCGGGAICEKSIGSTVWGQCVIN